MIRRTVVLGGAIRPNVLPHTDPPRLRTPAIAAVVALLAVACTSGSPEPRPSSGEKPTGGIYRVQVDSDFGFVGGFDPSGEYLGWAWDLYGNLLLRNLVTFRHTKGVAGEELVPDLATEIPQPSADGLTYDFHLKQGIRFGPPVDREIVARDFVTAFERIGTKSVAAQYGFYYSDIQGMQAFIDGTASEISGVQPVDDKTLRITLTRPEGDLMFRLAMPATAPFPAEVSDCFVDAGAYGRFVIASGPYMIQGSDRLDISSCRTMKPISGFSPAQRLALVRNPNYDAATDSVDDRENNVAGFLFIVNENNQDIFDKIDAGEVEGEVAVAPPQVLAKYAQDPAYRGRLGVAPQDGTNYITMNLTLPPFDDINIRRAVNVAVDKDQLRKIRGGPTTGDIATHIVPPTMTDGHPSGTEYDPYPSAGFHGDLARAKDYLRQSAYDTNGDGVCDAKACKNILFLTRTSPPEVDQAPAVEQELAPLGFTFVIRELAVGVAYDQLSDINRKFPIAINAGWLKDYPDPSTYMVLFDGRNITDTAGANTNYSLVGLTGAQARRFGFTSDPERSLGHIPNVDADIDRCTAMLDTARVDCWVALDERLMEDVVPWVPILWTNNNDELGPAVAAYDYDQFAGEAAYSKVAVDVTKQKGVTSLD